MVPVQPLYAGAMPMIFNATVLNALGVTGHLEAAPVFYAADEGGSLLHITCEWSEVRASSSCSSIVGKLGGLFWRARRMSMAQVHCLWLHAPYHFIWKESSHSATAVAGPVAMFARFARELPGDCLEDTVEQALVGNAGS